MIQDQLDKDQRLRLEALAQANARFAMTGMHKNDFFKAVVDFEKYIRSGEIEYEPEYKEELNS